MGAAFASALEIAPQAHAASTAAPMKCAPKDYSGTPYIECTVTGSGPVSLPDDLPTLMTDLPADTPVTLAAAGGRGGAGMYETEPGRGGKARTVVDYGTLQASDLHVYVSRNAGTRYQGGAASLVTSRPLGDGFGIDDVFVLAGGGGAQGMQYGNLICGYGGGTGGHGGTADAFRSIIPVSGGGINGAKGWEGFGCYHNGKGGTGGADGKGGTQSIDTRSNGADGVGGHGGGTNWIGATSPVETGWEPGAGGTTSVYAQGGGGYGGGAGGSRGGGGGGGGSYAAAAQAIATGESGLPGESTVTIAWPQPQVEVVTDSGAIDYYVDGKKVETLTGTQTVTIPAGHVTLAPNLMQLPAAGPALIPRADEGSVFVGWSGVATGAGHEVVPVAGDGEVFRAHFAPTP